LDDADGQNLASAEDLAKLGMFAVKNDFIKETVRLKDFEIRDLDGKYVKRLATTNKLLAEIPESVGIKTGTTTGAGEVLIYEYAKDKIDIVIVVMGSSDRFKDVTDALNWVLASYEWEK
jgi:D-alanyl-D-alanine carboxypeptidase (penicillin-binding protein 5/6)